MNEASFTKKVVMPFLAEQGYSRVEYHNGPTEKGKDIICQKDDGFGGRESLVVQVKAVPLNSNTSSQDSFQQLTAQLFLAFNERITNVNGETKKPDKIVFASSYPVNVKQLESCNETFKQLTEKGLIVLDGVKLAELITNRHEKLYLSLSGAELSPETYLTENPTNLPLLSALKSDNAPCIDEIYSDLDFCLGGATGQMLVKVTIGESENVSYQCEETQWGDIKKALSLIIGSLTPSFLSPGISIIESSYKQELFLFESKSNKERAETINTMWYELQKSAEFIKSETTILLQRDEKTGELKGDLIQFEQLIQHAFRIGNSLEKTVIARDHDIHNLLTAIEIWEEKADQAQLFNGMRSLIRIYEVIVSSRKKILQISSEISSLIPSPKYRFTIDSLRLSEETKYLQKNYLDYIRLMGDEKSNIEASDFFPLIKRSLQFIDGIEKSQHIKDLLRVRYESDSDASLSGFNLFKILDLGKSLSLIGEAGSGKSTALERYSKLREQKANGKESVIFLPLAKLKATDAEVELLKSISDHAEKRHLSINWLCKELAALYGELGLSMLAEDINAKIIKSKRVCLICDGFDELENAEELVCHAIREICQSVTETQVIWSSRFVVKGLADLSNVEINLLPFNDRALDRFISIWLRNKPSTQRELRRHLAKNIKFSEIIRNPLMATICCVLSENGVKLPSNQASLFEERFKLLFGHYDVAKNIRRCNTPDTILEYTARKCAYLLHLNKKRHLKKDALLAQLVSTTETSKFNSSTIEKAFSDLINPCNVLIKMDYDGSYGFGHLTYQEFLAAKELQSNRGLPIKPLLKEEWWFETLHFFGMLTDDISNILDEVVTDSMGNISPYVQGIERLIASKDKHDKEHFLSILKKHQGMDSIDYLDNYSDLEVEPFPFDLLTYSNRFN